jgi:agmatine/peptidylarginine deiminase
MPPAANGQYPNTNGDYRTYTNSVFVNKTIIVPFYEEKYDTIARRIYENLLPGYNVVGIDCNKIIPSLGAIHCITKEVGVLDPLMISVDQCALL